jgi:hypothetical protein
LTTFIDYVIAIDCPNEREPAMGQQGPSDIVKVPKKHLEGVELVANSALAINTLRKTLLRRRGGVAGRLPNNTEIEAIATRLVTAGITGKIRGLLAGQDPEGSIQTEMPEDYRWVDVDGFLVTHIVATTGQTDLELGDVVTHINKIPIGIDNASHAIGEILWYMLDSIEQVELTVMRKRASTPRAENDDGGPGVPLEFGVDVINMPPHLDVSDQGYVDDSGSIVLAIADVATVVTAGADFGIAVAIDVYSLAYLKTLKKIGKRNGLNVDALDWV